MENELYTGGRIYPERSVTLTCKPGGGYWTKDGVRLQNDGTKYIINGNTLTVLNTDPSKDTGKSK